MRIRWSYTRRCWLVFPEEIDKEEMDFLTQKGLEPAYYDNWKSGDVYYYNIDFAIGRLVDVFGDDEHKLEILY